MKNCYKKCIVFVFALALLTSCAKPYYSCDEEVNGWVCENLEEIGKMSRKDWLKVNDISYQRGIYNAFLVDQKIDLWVEKIDELLELNWSSAGTEHLIELQVAIKDNINWFLAECTDDEQDKKDMFMYQWVDYAINKLNWKQELIFLIAFTPERVIVGNELITDGLTNFSTIKTRSEGGWRQDCNCHNPESAQYLMCGKTGDDCFTGNCTVTSGGCGWLWLDGCNGLCFRRT